MLCYYGNSTRIFHIIINRVNTLAYFKVYIISSTPAIVSPSPFQFTANGALYPLTTATYFLGFIPSNSILFFVSIKNDGLTFCFWFVNFATNTSTSPLPGFTYANSLAVSSFTYFYDTVNSYIVVVYSEYTGSNYNLKYVFYTYVSQSSLTEVYRKTLTTYSTQSDVKYAFIVGNFLIVSTSQFTESFYIDFSSGSVTEFVKEPTLLLI
jgi:hypothetical protein